MSNYKYFLYFPIKVARHLRKIFGQFLINQKKDFTPMVIVNVDGGLGSQMWQFALGLSVAESCGLPVKYDLTWFKLSGKDIKGENNRNFDLLKVFSGRFDFPAADEKEIALYKRYFFYAPKLQCLYEKNVCFGKNARYLGGYYCHINYIKPIREKLIELFTPTIKFSDYNENMLQAITSSENPVAVHVRRGDFIGSIHDVTTPDYFIKAINLMSEKLDSPKFFIFSNDIAYAKELFTKQNGNFVFVEGNDNDHGYDDLNLMRQCKNFIISNSWFGWWAAFLAENKDKIVVAPDKWINISPEGKYIGNKKAWIDDNWYTVQCK